MVTVSSPGNRVTCIAAVFVSFTLISLSTGPDVFARPFRMAKLPDGGKNFSCATCHIDAKGGGARNSFGKDYQRIAIPAGDKFTRELGEKDSDGDGISNEQEFTAGTKPGDPASKP